MTRHDQPFVLFTDVPPDPRSEQTLRDHGIPFRYTTATDMATLVREGADAVAVVNGFTVFDAATLQAMPRLRLIALTSMGTDMVDLEAARERGVIVTAMPADAAVEEVALHAFSLMLAIIRNIVEGSSAVHSGKWKQYTPRGFRRLSEMTLGVIGLGRIGRELAGRYGVHFKRVVACDPFVDTAPPGIELLERAAVLALSDVISIHVPLSDATRHSVGADDFRRMQHGVVFINVSRGAVVDEQALTQALDAGIVAAAGLDVLEEEPPQPTHPLLSHRSVLLTPHIAYHSARSQQRYRELPIANVVALHRAEPLEGVVGVSAA